MLEPCCGCTVPGALMPTPGIGPATVGLRGFSLFLSSQPTTDSTSGASRNSRVRFFISNSKPHTRGGRYMDVGRTMSDLSDGRSDGFTVAGRAHGTGWEPVPESNEEETKS